MVSYRAGCFGFIDSSFDNDISASTHINNIFEKIQQQHPEQCPHYPGYDLAVFITPTFNQRNILSETCLQQVCWLSRVTRTLLLERDLAVEIFNAVSTINKIPFPIQCIWKEAEIAAIHTSKLEQIKPKLLAWLDTTMVSEKICFSVIWMKWPFKNYGLFKKSQLKGQLPASALWSYTGEWQLSKLVESSEKDSKWALSWDNFFYCSIDHKQWHLMHEQDEKLCILINLMHSNLNTLVIHFHVT